MEARCHQNHRWVLEWRETRPHHFTLVETDCPECGGHIVEAESQTMWFRVCHSRVECEAEEVVRQARRAAFFAC